MDLPKVSVIVPMYNTEKFIGTCIDSILLQTLKEIEIIIIDDCSTDRSFEIVQQKYSNDSRIKLFRNLHNIGVGATRNRGIEIATGKYIQFVDSDDAILPPMLETLFNRAEEKNLDVIYHNHILITKNSNFTMNQLFTVQKSYCHNKTPRIISDDINRRIVDEFINAGIWWMPFMKLIRRDFLFENQIYFPKMFSGEDMLFQLATLLLMKNSEVIDASFYIYRYRPDSITHSSDEKYLRETVKMYSVTLQYLKELWKKLPMTFSRENQITLEIFIIYKLMQMHCAMRGLKITEIDKILDEVTREGISIDPQLTSTLIKFMIQITRWLMNSQRGAIFELR